MVSLLAKSTSYANKFVHCPTSFVQDHNLNLMCLFNIIIQFTVNSLSHKTMKQRGRNNEVAMLTGWR